MSRGTGRRTVDTRMVGIRIVKILAALKPFIMLNIVENAFG